MCISSLEMYISNLEICISSLEMEFLSCFVSFVGGFDDFFSRPMMLYVKEKAAVWSMIPGRQPKSEFTLL